MVNVRLGLDTKEGRRSPRFACPVVSPPGFRADENFGVSRIKRLGIIIMKHPVESGDDQQHHEDEEKDLGDARRGTSEAAETKDAGDQREYEKSDGPVEHIERVGWSIITQKPSQAPGNATTRSLRAG
jgi:hypothetical protein